MSNKSEVTMGFFMPRAVAVWLIDHTALTFEQIANVCSMNTLEIQAIADGEVDYAVVGCNPMSTGELSMNNIHSCEKDPNLKLEIIMKQGKANKSKKRAYTPIARRRAKPDAILWLLKSCPELSLKQIIKLVGTTVTTIKSIADGTHRSMSSINPRDPVLLRLCSKEDLDDEILKAKIADDQEKRYDEARASTESNV